MDDTKEIRAGETDPEADPGDTIRGYRLGLPMWGFDDWVGTLYTADARPRAYLGQYAEVWNTVEGNTTFYSVPKESTVERWIEAVPETFRFCFKLPRAITHEHALVGAEAETSEFLERMAPLGPRLGPYMVQLPPSFGPERIEVLDDFLRRLPPEPRFAVELRHRAFFDQPTLARDVNDLLRAHGCERCLLDSRPMRAGDLDHPDVAEARHKKPDLPVEPVALGRHPLIRVILHPAPAVNAPFLDEWARIVAGWLDDDREPFVMIHTPNNVHSPEHARRFHSRLRAALARRKRAIDVGEIPEFPGERPAKGQMSLF